MPKNPTSQRTASRFRLYVLHILLSNPGKYNRRTLAEELGEGYDRVADAIKDIEAEFGLISESQNQLLSVVLPGPVRLLTPAEQAIAHKLDTLEG